jgi:hypothetical protein
MTEDFRPTRFYNLGDALDRSGDPDATAIIDLGGEAPPRFYGYRELDRLADAAGRIWFVGNSWMTVADYAQRVGVTPQTVRRKCRQGRLPATQINDRGDWLISPAGLRTGEMMWRLHADTGAAEIVAVAMLLDELELPIGNDVLLAIERLDTSLRRFGDRRRKLDVVPDRG